MKFLGETTCLKIKYGVLNSLEERGSVADTSKRGQQHTAKLAENIAAVSHSVLNNPFILIRRRPQAQGLR